MNEIELIKEYQSNDTPSARKQEIVGMFTDKVHLFIKKTANRYAKTSEFWADELYNEGIIWMLKALVKFDTSRTNKFITFAYSKIRWEILAFVKKDNKVSYIDNVEDYSDEVYEDDAFPIDFPKKYLRGLSYEERTIIKMYILSDEKYTLKDIWEELCCSHETVRKKKASALAKIEKMFS